MADPLIGPFLIALGAFLAAWLTVRTANKRHREQLEHDRDLQDQRLTHDRELHAFQLAHDRFLRERDATRGTIDEVTGALTRAMDALSEFTGDVLNADRYVRERLASDTQEEREALQRQWNQAMIELTQKVRPFHEMVELLRPAQLRLRLRFPDAHPVFRNFALVCSAVEQALELVGREHEADIRSDEVLAEMEESRAEVGNRLTRYVEAVQTWVDAPPGVEEYEV